MSRITRFGGGQPYVVDSEAAALVIPMARLAGASVQTAGALTMGLYGCNKEDPLGQTFVPVYEDGLAVQIVATAAGIWPFPDVVYKCLHCKLVGDQTTVDLCLKG